jgi:hypothetical protein
MRRAPPQVQDAEARLEEALRQSAAQASGAATIASRATQNAETLVCRGTWARATIGQIRHLARQTF